MYLKTIDTFKDLILTIIISMIILLRKNTQWTYVVFGMGESTLLLTSKFLGMWFLAIWMLKNVAILMFGFIGNLLRFLWMWDANVWFIPRNLKWIIYFSHSILRFECVLPNPFKKKPPLNI